MPAVAGPIGWVATVRRVEDGFFKAHADGPRQVPAQFSIPFTSIVVLAVVYLGTLIAGGVILTFAG
jgi:hypothetical protein